MSIFQSFLIKLGMLAMTMGVVLWIGWQVPQTMQRPAVTHAASLSSDDTATTTTAVVDSAITPAGVSESHRASKRVSNRPQPVDLNRATAADFDQLPGVGPVLAKRMVDYRRSVGRFYAVEDLRGVKGIGKKKLEQLKPFVTVTKSATPEQGKKGPI